MILQLELPQAPAADVVEQIHRLLQPAIAHLRRGGLKVDLVYHGAWIGTARNIAELYRLSLG